MPEPGAFLSVRSMDGKSRQRNAPCFRAPNAPLLQVSGCRCALDMGSIGLSLSLSIAMIQIPYRRNYYRFQYAGSRWLLMLPIPASALLLYWAVLRRCIQAYLGLGRGNKHLLSLFWPCSVHGLPVPSGGEASAAFIDVYAFAMADFCLLFVGERLFLAMEIDQFVAFCFILYFLRWINNVGFPRNMSKLCIVLKKDYG